MDVEVLKKEMSMGSQSKWFDYFDFDDSSGSFLLLDWDRSNGPGSTVRELQGPALDGITHKGVNWFQGEPDGCIVGKEMMDLDIDLMVQAVPCENYRDWPPMASPIKTSIGFRGILMMAV